MRSTFGVLLSSDGGKSWTWLCEQALGFSGTWDPPIAATRDGRLWAGLADGLRVTKDGCDVREIPELKGELVADLSTDARGDRVIAVTSTPDKPAHVWRTAAGGSGKWEKLGKGVTGFVFDTLDAAPSRPMRVYLTAIPAGPGPRAHVFRSDDGGATLIEAKVAQKDAGAKPYKDGRLFLAAVDPQNPDRILLRHANAQGSNILVSSDGGETFSIVLHTDASMFGFAKSDDGSTYWAGSGDPKEGIFRSTDRGETWENVNKTSVLCLHADGPRLFACSNPYALGGYAIAVSTNGGKTLDPLGTFEEVRGAVACDSGAGAKCAAAWNDVHATITAIPRAVAPVAEAGVPDAAIVSSISSIDASTQDTPKTPSSPARSACGCQASGAHASWPALISVTLLVIRRRRHDCRRVSQRGRRTAAY